MLGSEKKVQERQHAAEIANSQEANDSNVAMQMQSNPVSYDSQVSAMILEVNRRFLKWKVVFEDGQPKLASNEKYPYKELYADEALSFMEEDEERRLLNMFGSSLAQIKQFADKYDLDWHLAFNGIVAIRENFLINSRTTGRASRLAKSQYTDSTAMISRQNLSPQKKGFWSGLLG